MPRIIFKGDKGGSPPQPAEMMVTKSPIFIHSLFRTGSTYIWNKFRQDGNYYCFYEPFHPALSEITPANAGHLLTKDFASVNHPSLKRHYLHEYEPLLEKELPGVPFFKKSFSFDEFCNNEVNPDLKKYIDHLIAGAGDKIPVLQFNRSALRIKWFKKNYPGALNIYLIRNPRDQWESYFEVSRKTHDNIFFAMDILTAAVNAEKKCFEPLAAQIPLIDYHDSDINNEINFYRLIEGCYSPGEKYRVLYYTWLKSLIENVPESDFCLDINKLSEETPYRKKFEDVIEKHSRVRVSFSDAAIKKYDTYRLDDDNMKGIEESVQRSVFAALDPNRAKQAAAKMKNAGAHYLSINPPETTARENPAVEPTASPDIIDRRKQMILLLAEEYSLRGKKIQMLQGRLLESEKDRAARLDQIHTFDKRLRESNADRAARLDRIHTLDKRLQESNADRAARLDRIHTLDKRLQESSADRAAKQKVIHELRARFIRLETQLEENNREKQALELKVKQQKEELNRIRLSLSWRLTYPLRWTRNKLKPGPGKNNKNRKMRIAVDVTPVLPGGDNGGIKTLLWELLKRFHRSPGNDRFILLTAAKNHHLFDEFKLERMCVMPPPSTGKNRLRIRVMNRIKKRSRHLDRGGLLRKNGISVLFCPFAAPTFSGPGIPTVSVIADLQHIYYPFFFSKQELGNREHFYDQLRAKADYVIAISDYTRNTVIDKLKFRPGNVFTVPIAIQSRLPVPGPGPVQSVLSKYALADKKYCIYPANLWPHKNHRMLITAFAMFREKYPDVGLHLVLTGSAVQNDKIVTDSVKQMGLAQRVHFTGFLTGEELAVLWTRACFLIYPSLFEGFGIPLVEAMRYKKPILASNVTSIPEVAGDAALYFDPRKPGQIVNAIYQIMNDNDLYDRLVKKGQEQLKKYNTDQMVQRYVELIHKAGEGG